MLTFSSNVVQCHHKDGQLKYVLMEEASLVSDQEVRFSAMRTFKGTLD